MVGCGSGAAQGGVSGEVGCGVARGARLGYPRADRCPPQFSVQLPPTGYTYGGVVRRLEVADFNRDGKADIVALSRQGTGTVYLGAGNGTFPQTKSFSAGDINQQNIYVAVYDFNNSCSTV